LGDARRLNLAGRFGVKGVLEGEPRGCWIDIGISSGKRVSGSGRFDSGPRLEGVLMRGKCAEAGEFEDSPIAN